MPKDGISLYFTLKDGASSVLSTIGDKTKTLDKETQSLAQAYKALEAANKPLEQRQQELKKALEASGKAVSDARKEYRQYGDDLRLNSLNDAINEQDRLKSELKDVESQLKSNQKAFNDYREDLRRGAMEMESLTGSAGGSSITGDLWSSFGDVLGGLGIGGMMSDLLGNIADQQISSALGSSIGGAVSGALSSAISGAALGTAIAPGIGTALGAALGGITGALNGAMDIYAEKDDAFKEYYNSLIDTYGGLQAGNTISGSAIAAGRETDLISFSTMFGSREAAEEYLSSLVDMSNSTPFLYDDLTSMSKTLATYGYDENSILPVLQTIGDAGAALGQSTSDMNSVATAIGRMVSSDKASLEYLNILNDRGINAVGYLAEAKGVSQGDMYSMISKGEISGTDAAQIILDAMEEAYTGSMEAQSKTFAGLTSTLEGLQQEIANAAGEGYNTLRNEAIQTEIKSLNGALGDAMKEINTIIGENQARGENLQEEYMRAAISAVLLGENSGLFDDKQQAKLDDMAAEYAKFADTYENGSAEAGLHMQRLYEQALALGEAYYESSEWAQTEVDVQLEQIKAIRDNTAGLAAATDAWRIAQESSKGGASVISPPDDLTPDEQVVQDAFIEMLALDNFMVNAPGFAVGLPQVPYDNFPALLHEGERVLTANEARAYNAGGGISGGINIEIGELVVREEADVERIASELMDQIQLAEMGG